MKSKRLIVGAGLAALVGCSSSSKQTDVDPAPAVAATGNRAAKNGAPTTPAPANERVERSVDAAADSTAVLDASPPSPPQPAIVAPPKDQIMGRVTLKGVEKNKWFAFGGTYFRLWGTGFTGSQPKNVSVSHDGTKVYVTNTGHHDHNNVNIFDPMTLKVTKKVSFKGNAIEAMVAPDDSVVWISNFYHKEVLELDGASLRVKRRFKVQSMPKHMALSPDKTTLWISNWASGTTSVVDRASGNVLVHVKVGKQPRGTAILNSGKKVYVTNFGSKSVSVIDSATREVIKTIPVGCRAPRHAAVTADDRVLVTCYGGHELLVIDSVNDEILRRVNVGNGPKTVSISKDQRFAYTADYRGATMTIIDLTTWKALIVPMPVFKTSGLDVTSDDRRIYLTGWTSRNLMVMERLMPGDQPSTNVGPQGFGKVCRQRPKSDCYKYP